MLRMIFVRHGRTPWNVEGRVQGGGALDEVGRAQAAALGERLRSEPIAAIYASPALRARQTAQAAARRLGLPVRQRSLLRDLDYGRYGGALVSDVRRESPGLLEQWRERPDTVSFDGGETLADLRGRIVRFMAGAARDHDGSTILAATHDSPVRVAISLALEIDDSQHNQEDLRVPLASMTVLNVESARPELPTLVLRNDVEHLRGIDGAA